MLLEKMSTEDRISRQVNQELGKILPENSFAVFTSASLVLLRKREVSQGEIMKQQSDNSRRKVASEDFSPLRFPASYGDGGENALPGFSSAGPAEGSYANQQDVFMRKLMSYIDRRLDSATPRSTQKEIYHFANNYKIRRVLVDVLVDKRVPDKQYDLAEKSLIRKMRGSLGNQASVRFQKTHLISYDPPPTFSERLFTLLKQNAAGLLLMLLGVVFLFALLGWLFHRKPFAPSPHAMNPFPYDDRQNHREGRNRGSEMEGEKSLLGYNEEGENEREGLKKAPLVSSEDLHSLLGKFVDQMVKDPLLSRQFLRQLESEDKTKLLSCFSTHGMQENLRDTMNLSSLESEMDSSWQAMDEEEQNGEKYQLLVKVYNEMKQYCKMIGVQVKRRFGYLSLLDDRELKQVFDEVPLKYLSGVTKLIPSHQREELLNSLPLEKKKELFSFLTSNESDIPMEELKEYDRELKHRAYDIINTVSAGGGHASNTSIMDSLVSEVQDAQYILSDDMMTQNSVLADKYKFHRVTFEQFLSDDRESVLNCVDEVSNETLAQALLTVDEGLAQGILNVLSPDRRSIMGSLMSSLKTGEYESHSEIAKNEILKNYKNYLYSRRAS